MLSLVIPVYKNEASLPELFEQLEGLRPRASWPGYLDGVVSKVNGAVDVDALSRRLGELEQRRHARRVMR